MGTQDHCPECKELNPTLLLVRKDRLVKKCEHCGHKWSEGRGNWADDPDKGGAVEDDRIEVRKNGYINRAGV